MALMLDPTTRYYAEMYVREPCTPETGWNPIYRPASPSEIIEAARNLPGAEELMEVTETNAPVLIDGRYLKPGRYLVIPLDQAVADARRTDPPAREKECPRPGWQPTDADIERDYDEILGRTDPPAEEER